MSSQNLPKYYIVKFVIFFYKKLIIFKKQTDFYLKSHKIEKLILMLRINRNRNCIFFIFQKRWRRE